MSSKLETINLGLRHLGQDKISAATLAAAVAGTAGTDDNAVLMNDLYETVRKKLLRAYPFGFSLTEQPLTQVEPDGMIAMLCGTSAANGPYVYEEAVDPTYTLTYASIDATTCKVSGYTGTPIDVVVPETYGGRNVVGIGNYAFQGCGSLSSIFITESVTSIGEEAFAYCTALESITIPNTVTSIGDYCFTDCNSLSTVTLPASIASLGAGLFFGCPSLLSITIPASVVSIGISCFENCDYFASITFLGNAPTFGSACFENGAGIGSPIPATAYILSTATGWPTPPGGVGDPEIPTEVGDPVIPEEEPTGEYIAFEGLPSFTLGDSAKVCKSAGVWYIADRSGLVWFTSTEDVEFPWQVGTWTKATAGTLPAPKIYPGTPRDHAFHYVLPADCLRPLEIMNPVSRSSDHKIRFKEVSPGYLATDVDGAVLKYIRDVSDENAFTDLFIGAFSLALALEGYVSVKGTDNGMGVISQMLTKELTMAQNVDASSRHEDNTQTMGRRYLDL